MSAVTEVPDWILLLLMLAWVGLLAVVRWSAYRRGVWDGAFNHFLLAVQAEMRRYDERRTE